MKKGRFSIVLLLSCSMLLSALLGGCSDGRTGVTTEDDINQSAGRDITVGLAKDLDDSLDPHKTVSAGTNEVLFNVFEGLVKPDEDGNFIPAVASGYKVSDDAKIYTFTLRDGVKFHNGDAVTAQDVVYSIKRCAGMLEEEPEPLVTAFSSISDVYAADDKTVVVELSEGSLDFIAYMTAAIIPEGYDDQATEPIGTGPYAFVSRSAQDSIVLERFDDYWGDEPEVERVTFKVISADTISTSLLSGSIDLCTHLSPAQADEVKDKYTILQGNMNSVLGLYLNNSVAPLDNVDVRRALCQAVDRDGINDIVFEGYGKDVGSSMYTALTKYFIPELSDTYAYSADTAKQALSDAGYPDGFDIEITVASNIPQYVDTAQVIVGQLAAAGVTATIKPVDWETWISDVYIGGNYEATIVDFDASSLTARAMLERFTSDSAKNISKFSDSEYDTCLAEALSATDEDEQTELYKRCEEILSEQAANVYLLDIPDMVAMRSDLSGYTFYPMFVMDISKIKFAD